MNSSFLELLREEVTRCYADLVEIEGGMDRLPAAFVPGLRSRIRFGAEDDRPRSGRALGNRALPDLGGPLPETGDHVLVTVPFAVLRHVEVLSRSPRQAAGHPAAPLRRLGEDPPAVPPAFLGGGRRHPGRGHGDGPADPRPLLPRTTAARRAGACCWRATRGRRTRSAGARSTPSDRIAQALENVALIHPQVTAGVRGGHLLHVAPRRVRGRGVRALRPGPADAPLRRDRRARGADPLRGRGTPRSPTPDPGRDRVRRSAPPSRFTPAPGPDFERIQTLTRVAGKSTPPPSEPAALVDDGRERLAAREAPHVVEERRRGGARRSAASCRRRAASG